MPLSLSELRDVLLPGLRSRRVWMPPRAVLAAYIEQGRAHVPPEVVVAARSRARALLRRLLTPAQWQEFEHSECVAEEIEGRTYRLHLNGIFEASRPRGGIERWCVVPHPYTDGNDYLPPEDALIGKLLHLRASPAKLRAQANVTVG